MSSTQRTSALSTLVFAVIGIGAGLLLQYARSTVGQGPFVPPLSLPFTLLVLAAVLLALGISLRRAVTRKSGKAVNPFHAVRLLAGAKAAQFSGALFAGFGGGLALQLLSRTVLPSATTWVPMVLVLVAGVVLVVCGIVVESMCRVPPTDENGNERAQGEEDAVPGEPSPDAA